MIIGRIIGNIVATRKDPRLEGMKLLLVRPINPRGEDESGYLVAVDTVGAGYRERVLVRLRQQRLNGRGDEGIGRSMLRSSESSTPLK
ncbi:MAG UNVERIFIED_CONTAM: EutN/CcmL family microcompartment protein [Rickettsiaceae bacterium]